MANFNIKDLFKKLSFFKNNLALLVPILIAVVALLLFIPTQILGAKLRKTMEQSVQTARRSLRWKASLRMRPRPDRWNRTSRPTSTTSTRLRT